MADELADWANPILAQLSEQTDDYVEIALLAAMRIEIQELDKRLAQGQAQIDGLGWDKENW